jgi:hypothetical protein
MLLKIAAKMDAESLLNSHDTRTYLGLENRLRLDLKELGWKAGAAPPSLQDYLASLSTEPPEEESDDCTSFPNPDGRCAAARGVRLVVCNALASTVISNRRIDPSVRCIACRPVRSHWGARRRAGRRTACHLPSSRVAILP